MEEYDAYIEVNEDLTLVVKEWIYQTIINRTIKELQKDNLFNAVVYLNESNSNNSGILDLKHLDNDDYKLIIRYMKRAFSASRRQEPIVFETFVNKKFLREFKKILEVLKIDDRNVI